MRAMFSTELRNFNWFAIYNMVSYSEQFAFFKETLNNLLDKHSPLKSLIRHSSDKPWVNDYFRFVIRRRQRAYMQGDTESYNRYRNKVNRMAKSLKTEYYNNKVASPKHVNPSRWWREVNELTSSMPSRGVSSLQHIEDHVCGGDLSRLAEDINEFFVSLCHDMPPLIDVNNYNMIECERVPAKYVISVENVENQLSRLNTKKATGPDNIPTWVLRDFCQVLAGPVACLWNSSIREGKISNVWKSAYVSPLPKVTLALEVRKDLRPISLTHLLSKGLESHVVKWLSEIIFDKIDPKQFGSVKDSSTVHALVELLHNCYNSTDASRNFVWILLLDYLKAFDLINHQFFLPKLSDMGTQALLLRWIAAFLTARQQQLRIGGSQSSCLQLCGGGLQGILMGVILFVVHINDLEFECQYSK